REHNRRILHAARTGTPRPPREHHDYDFHHHPTVRRSRQARRIVLDFPEGKLVRRPGRPQYDEPPF
ncbi:MAG TPA: hypothetical protein PK868_04175, partial [Phycicoccus sp.]|nr:hypothetical protein [Phycicoccus sp.]